MQITSEEAAAGLHVSANVFFIGNYCETCSKRSQGDVYVGNMFI